MAKKEKNPYEEAFTEIGKALKTYGNPFNIVGTARSGSPERLQGSGSSPAVTSRPSASAPSSSSKKRKPSPGHPAVRRRNMVRQGGKKKP
jgi:hypothetical protein